MKKLSLFLILASTLLLKKLLTISKKSLLLAKGWTKSALKKQDSDGVISVIDSDGLSQFPDTTAAGSEPLSGTKC